MLDDPTAGLCMADVEWQARVPHHLVGGGPTLIVIEGPVGFAEADRAIDL